MSGQGARNHRTDEEQVEKDTSTYQENLTSSEEQIEQPDSAQTVSNGANDDSVEASMAKPTMSFAKSVSKKVMIKPVIKATSHDSFVSILKGLTEVETQMRVFREYVETQKDEDKPLYQWAKFAGYPDLNTAVSELDKAMTKFKRGRYPQSYVTSIVAQAMSSSTSVSKAASYALSEMNKKTGKYLEEMETSTLSNEAKMNANALITAELQNLMEHSTRAAERVWVATDLLRTLEAKHGNYKDWAWSATGTMMTAALSAVVGILTAHLVGPAGFDVVPHGGHSGHMYRQVINLVQHTQAVTNLTGELYTIKLRDIDQRVDALSALSESHGERIDSIVDDLGPPNEEGTYCLTMPKKIGGECCNDIDSRLRKVSDDASRQMQRLHEEMQLMRKNVNRMNIRLTSGLEKVRKG